MQKRTLEFRRRAGKLVRTGACALGIMASVAAMAQVSLRMLPADAKKGQMKPPDNGKVVIDGKSYTLAPGLRLRDTSNTIVFPQSIRSAVTVRYTIDAAGLVDKVWILTPQEAAMPDPTPPASAPPR